MFSDDFGFTGVLWVYSGRRGIHCWVSCAEARSLSSAGRGAVADYLAVVSGGESQAKKVHLNSDNIHTSIKYVCVEIKCGFLINIFIINITIIFTDLQLKS